MKKSLSKLTDNKKIFLFFLFSEFLNLSILLITNYLKPINKLFSFDNNSWGILRSYGNFDGFHYWHIAKDGYGLYQEAFFPLYPVLIKISSFFTNTYFINGLIISNISFALLLFIIFKLIRVTEDKSTTWWFLIFFLSFPTSFFLTSYYTESTFLLFFTLSLYFLTKEKYLSSSIFGYFAALTRFIGLFTVIPIFIYLLTERKKLNFRKIAVLFSPVLGFLSYSTYLYIVKGDFLLFINTQPSFGANRSNHLILLPQVMYRYLKILLTFKLDITYFVAILELSVFSIFLLVLLYQLYSYFKKRIEIPKNKGLRILVGLNLFSLTNLLLPTLSGTLSSIPRYALLSLSFFIFLAAIKSVRIKFTIAVIFIITHIILFKLFLEGIFIG